MHHNTENCIQAMMVMVKHTDGSGVQVTVASCLPWDRESNPQGRMALTEEQAIALADDDRLRALIPQRLVDEGAQRFPGLLVR